MSTTRMKSVLVPPPPSIEKVAVLTASSTPTEEPNELVRVTSQSARRTTMLDHFKQLGGTNGKQSGPKVRLEVIEPEGARQVSPGQPAAKGRLEVVDEQAGSHGVRHFLARLFEKGKKVVHKTEGILGGLEETVVTLGPDEDAAPPLVPNKRRNQHSAPTNTTKSLDEYPVQGKIKIMGTGPVATGGYCEVFQGQLRRKGQKDYELVAMKRLVVGMTPEADRKMFRRETNAWNKMRHPNVLPFYGTVMHKHHLFMISPWAHHGTLIPYLKANHNADRKKLLLQIAKALSYIHNDCKIVHGDVKGANVFVTEAGDALVADFGLATHIEKLPNVTATAQTVRTAMTPRFSAPELLLAAADIADNEGKMISSIKSRATDVYAFGMVILQVYTLERPWAELNTERVFAQVLQGHKPRKPEPDSDAVSRGLTPFLWDLVERCLETKPAARPSMSALVVSLSDGTVPVGAADLSGEIIGQHAVSQSHLLVAQRRKGNSGEQVALRMPKKGDRLQVQKKIQSEVQALSLIQHSNILPFYGTAEIGSHLFIVTPWMENGNITSYISNNPQVNRYKLLYQTCDALSYLHSGRAATIGQMIHGALQPGSILINNSGDALLTDFGLSNLLEDLEITGSADSQIDDTAVRFHPPEFFHSENGVGATAESDVYSFAMVMLQVLTDTVPFADAKNYFAVINKIIRGKTPERPRGMKNLDDATWELLTKCWSYHPEDRPSMEQVRDRLASALKLQIENNPGMDKLRSQMVRVREPSVLDVDE